MARASAWNGVCVADGSSPYLPTARISPASTGSIFVSRRRNEVNSAGVIGAAMTFTRALYRRASLLAVGAPVGGTAVLRELFDGPATDATRLSLALVDVELLTKIARVAVGADIVTQCRAAHLHGHGERGLDRPRELRALGAAECPRLASRLHACAKQRFARVDVPDADDETRIHDQLLDGHRTAARDPEQIVGIEVVLERLRREAAQQRMQRRIA